jgi:hypothetical protein
MSSPTEMTPFLKEKCILLTNKFIKWELTQIFRERVNPRDVPDYEKIIKEPMWLNEVKKRLRDGTYKTLEAYSSDMSLIWKNAMTFNHRADTIYKYAEVAEERFLHKMSKLQKTPDEEYIYKLTKNARKVASLTTAFQQELDHTSTAIVSG